MAKGAWAGTLKDDADFTKMNLKDGQQILLMGTAEVIAAPVVQVRQRFVLLIPLTLRFSLPLGSICRRYDRRTKG